MNGILDYLRKEGAVLRNAPLAFMGLAALFFMTGIGVSKWHYSERLDAKDAEIRGKDGQIQRYRMALGIDPGSKGALVELNNEELALKAQGIAAKLRQIGAALDARAQAIDKQVEAGKLDKDQAFRDKMAFAHQLSEDFESNSASDTYNVDNELRRRLDPSAIGHVITVPITALVKGSGFDVWLLRGVADEIEQMAKLLPK